MSSFICFTLLALCTINVAFVSAESVPLKEEQHSVTLDTLNPSKELRQRVAHLPFFSAQFRQRVIDFDGSELQQSKGDLALQTPNRFRWHQLTPDETLLVSNGKAVYMYDPLLEQVSIYDASAALIQTPIALLADLSEKTWKQYSVVKESSCYKIVPKLEQSIAQMKVCFADRVNQPEHIERLQLVDSQGLITFVTLEQFNTDRSKAPHFDFVAPKGTLIDDQRTGIVTAQ